MASKYDIVKLHIDTKGFSSKPSGKGESAIGKVIKRMSRNVYSVTKEKFVEMVGSGHSFIPGLCDNSRLKVWEGVKQKDWMQQDLFFLDFDNEDVKRKIKNSNQYKLVKKIEYITMQDAKAKLESFGIKVMIVYRTFSDGKLVKGKNIEKGRIGVAMSETVTDREKRDKLQAILMGLMATHIDNSCSNRNRYFNGTSQDRIDYVDYTAVNDADEIIERLWKEEYTKYYPKDAKVKKHKNCKNEANKGGEASVEESEPRDCKTYELTPVKEFPDIFPKVHNGLLKYNMQVHLDEFLGWVDETLK